MAPKHLVWLGILGSLSWLNLPAATKTWNGGDGTGSNFSAATNWVGGVAPASDLTTDTARFDTLTSGQPMIAAARSVAGIDLASANGGWNVSGAGPLTLGAGGIGASGQTNGVNAVSVASIILGAGSTWNLFNASVAAANTSSFNLSSTIQLNPSGQLVLRLQRPSTGAGVGTLNLTGPLTGNSSGGVKLCGTTYTRNTISISGGGSRSTYNADTVISQATVNFDVLANSGGSSGFGSSGSVTVGDNASFALANCLGAGGGTDRRWLLAGSGGGGINNNGSGPLAFNSPANAVTGSGNRRLQLGGANPGANLFAQPIADAVSGVTRLTKSDAGTWVLTGSNSYSGATLVTGGILRVNGSLGAGSAVTVQAGGTLGGNGTIGGPVTVQAGGSLQPGSGGGDLATLSLNNSLSLADGSLTLMVVNRTNTPRASSLAGLTTVAYGGTLTVTNAGPALQAGDLFTLFGAGGYSGWFSALNLPPLGAGLSWDATTLGVDGTLRVGLMPAVTVTPSATIAACGETVVLTASVTNSASVAYQWYDNRGSALPGATNPSLTLSNVQPAQSGSWAVVASTTSGPVTNAVSVTVLAPAPPGLYPQGDEFSFTFYSTLDADSVYSLSNGATALGPYYGDQSAPLSKAASLKTKLLYKVTLPSLAGLGPADFDDPNFVWPSDQTISNQTVAIVQNVCSNAAIGMWDVEPEELRCWKPKELHFLALVCALIHANDPYHRPVYMYEPNNRTAQQLAQTVVYQDLCGKGMYVNIEDMTYETSRIWARWSMEQELGGVAAGNPAAVPAIVPWMAADPPTGDYGLITNWCRHDLYMGLILGGKAIRIWSGYRGRTGFSDTNFQAYLNGYLTVARDLNGPLHLAPVFLYGQRQSNVTMTVTSGPVTLSTFFNGATNVYPSITYLNTLYGGTNYFFLVNSSAQPVTACFSGLPATARTDLFGGGTAATPGGSFTLSVPGFTAQAFQFGSPPPPPPPLLSLQAGAGSGGQPALVISWPLSYTNYILQGQTNPPGSGLGTNWGPVAGVVSNQLSLPIVPTNGAVFFRLLRTP